MQWPATVFMRAQPAENPLNMDALFAPLYCSILHLCSANHCLFPVSATFHTFLYSSLPRPSLPSHGGIRASARTSTPPTTLDNPATSLHRAATQPTQDPPFSATFQPHFRSVASVFSDFSRFLIKVSQQQSTHTTHRTTACVGGARVRDCCSTVGAPQRKARNSVRDTASTTKWVASHQSKEKANQPQPTNERTSERANKATNQPA